MRPANWATILGIILLGAQFALTAWSFANPGSSLSRNTYPAETAGRLFDRHLEIFTGIEAEPDAVQALVSLLYGRREDVENDAIAAYREVLASTAGGHELPAWNIQNTRARLLILLGETGRLTADNAVLEQLAASLEGHAIAQAIALAYLNRFDPAWLDFVDTGIRLLPEGWPNDIVTIRVAARMGDTTRLNWVAGRLAGRSHDIRMTNVFWLVATAMVMITGLLALLRMARKAMYLPAPIASIPPPWSMKAGLVVALWSAVCGLLIVTIINVASGNVSAPFAINIFALWSTLFASLPMVWLIHRRLLRPHNLGFTQAFGGLWPARGAWWTLAGLAAAVFVVEKSGAMAVSWLAWTVGGQPHWSEHLAEALVWSSDLKRSLAAVDLLIWAPLLEELGFRGLLYVSLRGRFGVVTSAIISSSAFAAFHFYSIAGALALFWSGLVFCAAVEKTRSLLPAIIAHMLGNAIFLGFTLTVYRG